MATLPVLTEEQRKELTDSRSDYTADERVSIAVAYLLEAGHSEKAARKATKILGKEVRGDTIRQWCRRPWWKTAVEVGRLALQKDMEHKYTRFLHMTEKEMVERVQKGDSRMTKDGQIVLVPVSLRDLVGAHAVVSDKLAMLRGEPTSRTEDKGLALANKLLDVLHTAGAKRIRHTLEGEFEVVEDAEVK